jgi:hypothetical protein
MAQYARPDGDTTLNNWQDNSAGTTDIYQAINEASADDADFIRSQLTPTGQTYIGTLGTVLDPDTGTCTLRWRRRHASGSGDTTITVTIKEGASTVASDGPTACTPSWVADSLTFSDTAVTDWSDLNIEIAANQTSGTGRRVQLSWLELETPDATAGTAPYAPTGLSAAGLGDSMALAWNDTNSGTTQYRVYGKRSTDSQYSWLADLADGATSYVDEWLISDTSYDYRVTAWDGSNESEYASTTGTTGTVLRVSGSFL